MKENTTANRAQLQNHEHTTVLFIKSGRVGQTPLPNQMRFEYLVAPRKREVMSYTTSDICYDIT